MPIRRPAHGCHGYSSSRNSVLWAFSSLVVQFDQAACLTRLQASSTRGVRDHIRRVAGCATSTGFAGHLLHTVKTELGHQARARYGYVISLGTPVSGAQIANVGLIVKQMLHMRDPLLQSLENDNTFLRMLAHWRRSENIKATRFDCRPVALYAGIEGARLYRFLKVVPQSSAETPLRELGLTGDFAWFDDRDHMSIAKPVSEQDPVYDWVNRMMTREMTRLNKWQEDHPHELCRQVIDVDD